MTSKFQRMWEESERKVRTFERIRDGAATEEFLRAAMRVINKHGLGAEFVEEISRPKQTAG